MNEYSHVLREIRSYLLEKDRSKNTILTYTFLLREMLKWIGKLPSQITYSDIYRYKQHLKDRKIHNNSLRVIYSGINLFCRRYKIKDRDDVILKLDIPKVAPISQEREPLNERERDKLYEVSFSDTRDYAIIRCGIEGCLRISEITALNTDDILKKELVIDGKTETVYMLRIGNAQFTPKDESYGYPVITKETYDALQRWLIDREPKELVKDYKSKLDILEKQLDNADTDSKKKSISEQIRRLKIRHSLGVNCQKALFLNYRGERLSTGSNTISKMLKDYGIKAGITKNLHPHILRHPGIYFLKQKGFSNSQIQAQSRHKSSQALDRYGKQQITDTASMVLKTYNNKPIQPDIKPTPQPQPKPEPKPTPNISEIEIKLLQRLANGEITGDVYRQAIQQLRKGLIKFLNLLDPQNNVYYQSNTCCSIDKSNHSP